MLAAAKLPAQSPQWDLTYTADYLANRLGGLDSSYRYLDNVDLSFSVPVKSGNALSLPAGQLFGYLIYNNANQFSTEVVGDMQFVSNIDNPFNLRLYELWYEIPVNDWSSFKAGLMDLNTEFDSIQTAQLFLHASHGIGFDYSQSGLRGPSIFPVTSVAVRFGWERDQWSWRIAAFDAVPGDPDNPRRTAVELSSEEGALLATELNYRAGRTRVGLGAWIYTEPTAVPNAMPGSTGALARNQGLYGFIEQQDYSVGRARISWWLRAGGARGKVNASDAYLGAGLVVKPVRTGARAQDELGIAVASTLASNSFNQLVQISEGKSAAAAETSLELTYRYQVNERLSLQPDLQYVFNPGLSGLLEDTLVFGLRLKWSPF